MHDEIAAVAMSYMHVNTGRQHCIVKGPCSDSHTGITIPMDGAVLPGDCGYRRHVGED